jgi:voltage-gated potassium channel
MPAVPRLQFPEGPPDPRRSLLQRLGIACGIVVFIALLTWLGRGGYSDADGTPISPLDALYYSTVTVTTTGYGDIAPVSAPARAVTAFVVTPLRILFLIVLVGTTIELLTERFRQTRIESRWRRHVKDHTIVAGYGTMGRGAVETLLANGTTTPDQIVVIDPLDSAVASAHEAGCVAIQADATRTTALQQGRVDAARAVIVTCNRDDTATLVTLTARELNPTVPISAAVREAENAHLLSQSGATNVVLSSEAAGRLIGLSTEAPRAVSVLEDLLVAGAGLEMVERALRADEVGGPPRHDGGLPIALVRGPTRIPFDDDAFQRSAAGDFVVCLTGRRGPRSPRPSSAWQPPGGTTSAG